MKTTTAEHDLQAAAKLREMIEDISVAMLITVTTHGALRSRPMLTQEARQEGELWFFTSDDSEIAEDLALLCVRIESAEYWDAESSRMKAVNGPRRTGTDGARVPKTKSDANVAEKGVPPTEHTKVEIRATPASG